MNQGFKFKKDKYKEARGNYSRFLNIYCSHCSTYLLLYQKDGSGPLKRLYLDRIFAPAELTGVQKLSIKDVPELICKKCKRLIGIPAIYKEENRKVYLLLSYSFNKRLNRGKAHPPKGINTVNKNQ